VDKGGLHRLHEVGAWDKFAAAYRVFHGLLIGLLFCKAGALFNQIQRVFGIRSAAGGYFPQVFDVEAKTGLDFITAGRRIRENPAPHQIGNRLPADAELIR
jgi:hypothetical protein